jgi:cytochrome c biogenesis protein CcdA
MNDYSEQTIRSLGKRSSTTVMGIASVFAVIGAAASLASMFTQVGLMAFAWIPLCFLVIPPLHFLCREFLRLQERVRELEMRLEQK